MLMEIKEGLSNLLGGATGVARASRTGAQVVTHGHGNYTEPATKGAIMEACTPVAGIAPGTALSTSPPLTLWNPPSSGKNLAILKSYMGFISGTLGGGSLVYAVVPSQVTVPSGGTELVPLCSNVGFPRGVGRVFQSSVVSAVPTIMRPAFILGSFLNTSVAPPDPSFDHVEGAIIVPPGACLCLQAIAAAGTSPLVLLALIYEELPL
jgi:hypothetical protein